MTSPSDDSMHGSNAPDAFSPDLQPLQMPKKVTIRKKDRAKYSQEEEHIAEGGNNMQEEDYNNGYNDIDIEALKPTRFSSNLPSMEWLN